MQRRTMATFARVWQDDPRAPTWYSAPGCSPVLCNGRDGVTFSGKEAGLWPVGRYLALILGELPRLADNPQGYGPRVRDLSLMWIFRRTSLRRGRRCATTACSPMR